MTIKENGIIYVSVNSAWVLEVEFRDLNGNPKQMKEYFFNKTGAERRLQNIASKLRVIKASLSRERSLKGL